MFVVDKDQNKIIEIESKTFREFGFREKEHLQEWIADNPCSLGEELLIIQKEFDGFNDTFERLDLLALDKTGALVVIENKLDDTGKDVLWQVLKYVSYCSTLSKIQIRDIYQQYLDKYFKGQSAEENIVEFFKGKLFSEISLNDIDQRIVLVAARYRKEVTSSVLWMINHSIKAQCFKVTPFSFENQILLDFEQIIPIKEAEEYMIRIADKTREEKLSKEINSEIENARKQFWKELLEKFSRSSKLYENVNPSDDHWLSTGSGVGGVVYNFVVTKTYASVELLLEKPNQELNKKIFDKLVIDKEKIELDYGKSLTWERLDLKKASRITDRMFDVDISNKEDWEKIKDFLCKAMPLLEKATKDFVKKASK